jgi:hypothetical protein
VRPRFIVSECALTWPRNPPTREDELDPPAISKWFERTLNHNAQRGYELVDWKVNRIYHPSPQDGSPCISETILAIFKDVEPNTPEGP